MDGLSLLCNLHAEGPVTLRRLREAGVRSLGDLGGVPRPTLAAWLRTTPAHARRFVEEGRLLAQRLAEAPLEPEQAYLPPHEIPEERHVSPSPAPEFHEWRSRPRAFEAGGPRPDPDPAVTPLRPGLLVGLDERSCSRLAELGVTTVECLIQEASLALARGSGLRYARLLELAAQGRLLVEQRSQPTPARHVELVPEPTRRPLVEETTPVRSYSGFRTEPGSAGPFG